MTAARKESVQGVASSETEPEPQDEKRSQATRIVDLALEEYRFGMSRDGLAFAEPRRGPHLALSLGHAKGGFRSSIAARFLELYGKVPASNGLNDAIRVLHHYCDQATPEPVALRVSGSRTRAILDLGVRTGEAVVIEPGGWQLVEQSPALFRRTTLTLPLPMPTSGGSLELLRDLINCSSDDWSLLRAVLVAALIPEISHPIVAFTGEQGTGKTTAMRLICKVLDPGRGGNRAAPTKEDDWAVAASASYLVGLDNVSAIRDWLSDALCRAVTGAAWLKRQLYTDADLSVLEVRRVVFMNGIDLTSVRGDLADRLLLLELDGIPSGARRTDEEVEEAFARAHPEILGGLLDLAARVFERLPFVKVRDVPRLADFAKVVAAVDELCTSQALGHYLRQRSSLDQAVLDSDVFAGVLCKWLDDLSEPTELLAGGVLEVLNASFFQHSPPPKQWPSTPKAVSGRLRRLGPSLRRLGYRVEERRPSGTGHRRSGWLLGPRESPETQPEQPEVRSVIEPNGAVEAVGAVSREILSPPAGLRAGLPSLGGERPVDTMVARVRGERSGRTSTEATGVGGNEDQG